MKKIAILIDQFYEHGGIEKLVSIKANYWSKYFNYDVTLIATENKNKPYVYELEKSVNFIDLKINFNREKSYFSSENLKLFIKNVTLMQNYIDKNRPDYILVASHIPITYILPFLSLNQTKTIKEFHFTQFYRKEKTSFKNKVFNFIESKYDKLIVLSKEERSFYKTDNVIIVPNPITSKSTFNESNKTNTFSVVCRFAPVKQLEILVEVWKNLIEKLPDLDWDLNIFGDYKSEYGNKVNTLIQQYNLQDSINLKGQSNKVLEEIKSSKALLITSSQECFPMVILEAQSVGVPVISFDCPTGPRNIINNYKDGILVEHNTIEDFVSKLIQFITNENLQNELIKNSLKNAEKYTLEKIMNLWKEKVFN
ncbi:glycosyltransferase [Arcobacter roscoffensis]|uniref:Glycosyltransferase n=1 Tax=Arcobacter roscoffensis TaxID=2961520 RepID=A0ABY5E0R1_9BACT|nr:glycosyltransferase [Arcobacter roscoffensis]UTJ05792.1 glycosyltransferase [Arcobacter roscoffensis]